MKWKRGWFKVAALLGALGLPVAFGAAGTHTCEPIPIEECEPMAYYGPQPCQTDADCVEWYGEGWYCDDSNTFDDGCGNMSTWPMCEQRDDA